MKILLVNSSDPTRWGGAEVWMRRTLDTLASMGHEARALAREDSPVLESGSAEMWDGGGARLVRELRSFQPQLAVAVLHEDLRALAWRRRAARGMRIAMARHLPSPRPSWKRRWMYRHLCDALWVPSEYMKKLLHDVDHMDEARVHVLAPSMPHFQPRREPHGEPVVACVGRLSPEKGQDVLLRALAQMRAPARLLLVGTGPELPRLRALAEQLGVASRVEWRERERELGRVYAACQVAAQPSRMESFGLSALEALARGVPLVVSDVGGLPEVVGECALRVRPEDPAALAGALDQLLEDPALRSRLAEGGRNRARRRFTADAERAALAKALEGATR